MPTALIGQPISFVLDSLADAYALPANLICYINGRQAPKNQILVDDDVLAFGFPECRNAYFGSDGAASRSVCTRLEKAGQMGKVAAELFRIMKASARAKVYRRGFKRGGYRLSFRDLAYERKTEHIGRLCFLLQQDSCGFTWGWGRDEEQKWAKWVLYLDLPQGQVSFHCEERFLGPDYFDRWDGERASEKRVVEFCDWVLNVFQD